ncbi:hypothetical protein CKO15_13715 [Halorhodospira abdelmalekii]|uniref:hypothetical protein n=1 Tax=Halorhodospira abdelmalekii TaxID=421629 RepID=UPI001907D586|nr:hypothetical protein [Halorhodospira abdelmalekii]MBK1736297.1 hypothetical protein [Halorhodospira abdelmalekii]
MDYSVPTAAAIATIAAAIVLFASGCQASSPAREGGTASTSADRGTYWQHGQPGDERTVTPDGVYRHYGDRTIGPDGSIYRHYDIPHGARTTVGPEGVYRHHGDHSYGPDGQVHGYHPRFGPERLDHDRRR